MRHVRCFCSFAAVTFAASFASATKADPVYVTRPFDKFGTIDVGTGVYTEIATTTVQLNAISLAPDGTLYGIGGTNGELYKVNTKTGALTDLGNPGSFFSLNSLAVRSDSTIFGDDPFGKLYTVNPNNALATVVGTANLGTALQDQGCLTFGANNTLYSIFYGGPNIGEDVLYTRNQQNGLATQSGAGPTGINTPGGLVYDNNKLYAFDFFGAIYTIDPASGIGTPTGVTVSGGFGQIYAAAPVSGSSGSGVPEGGTLSVALLGIAGIGLVVRRKIRC